MTSALESPSVAAFDPTVEQVAVVSVSLPAAGTRTTIPQPTGDAARVLLGAGTGFAQVCVSRQGDAVMVTAQGYGQLVIERVSAGGPNPPEVQNRQGEVVQAETLGAGCGTAADSAAAITPAAGGNAPAAPPAGAAGVVLSGGHFGSSFDPSAFLGLDYGPVDPLAFTRGPPPLDQGPGLIDEIDPFTPGPGPGPDAGDLLEVRQNFAIASIPTGTAPSWSPVGNPIDPAALIANEGTSVYSSGNGGLVGPLAAVAGAVATSAAAVAAAASAIVDTAGLHLLSGADVTISLINENASFQNITGYYTYDGGGPITGVQMLWLNSAPDGGHAEADFYGKTGDLTLDFHVDDPTDLGFFLISDGAGDGSLTPFGDENKALFNQLFAALGIDPTTLPDSNAIIDVINQHLRYDTASDRIQVDVDGNPGNGAAGWTSLAGFQYFSHDPTLNSDNGLSNLSANAASHTVSGVNNGAQVIGFEDLPFIGTANDPSAPTGFVPGSGYPAGVAPPDFDYNDSLFDVRLAYTPPDIGPGVWAPLAAINNTLNNGAGSIVRVQFAVAGLGDGVSLNDFASLLSPGWTVNHGALDAHGNGVYTVLPPGGAATSAAFVAELNLEVIVSGSTPASHQNVTIDATATDATGLVAAGHAVMTFQSGGTAPPVAPEVHIDAGSLPPALTPIDQLLH